MSDSLLNLLEVLNEVLEEQGLQEQASGGAPDFAKLKKDIDTFILSSEEAFEELKAETETKRGKRGPKATKELIDNIEKPWKSYDSERASDNIMLRMYAAYMFLYNTVTNQRGKSEIKQKYYKKLDTFSVNITEHIFLLNTNFLRLQSGNPHETSHQPLEQSYKDFFDVYKAICQNCRLLRAPFWNLGRTRMMIKRDAATTYKYTNFVPIVAGLLDNLSEGIGTYRVAVKPTKHTKPDQLADKVKVLDYLDFKAMRGEMSKPFIEKSAGRGRNPRRVSHLIGVLEQMKIATTANPPRGLVEPQRSLFLNLVKETFTDIFDVAIKDSEKNHKWKNQINFLLESVKGLQIFPELRDYFSPWAEEFKKRYTQEYRATRMKHKVSVEDPEYQRMIGNIRPNLGKTFTSPRINLSDGSLSNDFLFTVDNFFDSGTNDFNSRLNQYKEKMSIFSKNPQEFEKELTNITTIDFMNRVLLMDYFVEFSKGFTNTTAGVLFEYFLAGLFNGEVVGHRQGVTDFKVGKELYSAKFLAPGSPARQAISRFEDEPEKTITYILGKKLKSYKAKPRSTNPEDKYTFGVEEIHDVDLYKFDIKYSNGKFYVDGSKEESNLVRFSGVKKQSDGESEDKDTRMVIMDDIISNRPPFTRISVMSTDKNTIRAYREALKDKLVKTTAGARKNKSEVLEFVQKLFDDLKDGDSSARRYVSSGDKSDGVKAITKLESATIGINDIMKIEEYSKFKDEPNDA